MKDKKIKEFNKIYLDTIQHSKNIKKWIDASSRKKGDLKKSMQRLESKYSRLLVLKKQLEQEGISLEALLGKTSRNNSVDDYKSLIKDIEELYHSTKTAIPDKLIQEKRKLSAPKIKVINAKEEIDYTGDIEDERAKYYQNEYIYYSGYYQKPPLLYKLRWRIGNFAEKAKEFFERSKKAIIRTTSVILVSAIALAGGISAGESNSKETEKDNNSISYTTTTNDSNKSNNIIETSYEELSSPTQATPDSIPPEQSTENSTKHFEDSEPTEVIEETTPEQNGKKNTIPQKESKFEVGNGTYLAKANTKYTEVSDGSGNWGYFSKDTKVRVYNRALVRTDKNGNKQILEVSKIGQTWQEFAEENGMNYEDFENYIEDNNIEKCVSLESPDGNSSYGWISEKALEKAPEKDIELIR